MDDTQKTTLQDKLEKLQEQLNLLKNEWKTPDARQPDTRVMGLLEEVLHTLDENNISSDTSLWETISQNLLPALQLSQKGVIQEVNSAFFELTGFNTQEIIGENFSDLIITSQENIAITELPTYSKVRLKSHHGIRNVSIRLMNDGNHLILLLEDITEYVAAAEKYKRDDQELRDFFARSSDFILVFDEIGNLLFVNDTCSNALGYPDKEMVEKNLFELLTDNSAEVDLLKMRLKRACETGKPTTVNLSMVSHDQNQISLKGQVTCRKSYNSKQPNIYRMFLTNVTELLATEKIINKQEARLEAMFESGNQIKWVIDRNFRLVRFNENFRRAYKNIYDVDVYKGMQTHELHLARKDFSGFWDIQYAKALDGNSRHFQLPIKTRNHESRWLDVVFSPVRYGDSVKEVYAIAQDITEEKQTELELKASETKFSSVFSSLRDVVYFQSDLQGNILMVTPSIYEMTGWTAEEASTMSLADFYVSETAIKEEIAPKLLVDKEIRNYSHRVIHRKTGEERYVSITFWLSRNHEGKHVVQGVAKDITDLRNINIKLEEEKEKAKEASEVKRQFLSKMSHEMRTPLNGIIGILQLMQDTHLDDEQRKYIRTIINSTNTLQSIIDDILDWSKIEAGRMKIEPVPIDPRLTMEKVYDINLQSAREKNLHFICEIDPTTPEVILADEIRIIQILNNLVSNAIKYTKEGSVTVRMKGSRKFKKHILMFEIEDTGVGISDRDRTLMFDSYLRLDNPYSKMLKGTGLGLAIARELCHMMEGEIYVESELGKGSVFWFTVEAEDAQGAAPTNQPAIEENAFKERFKKPPSILFVDDNATNRKVGRAFLEKAGCLIEESVDGDDAVKKATSKMYDLIIMDIQMPVKDGVTATKELREKYNKLELPIIALTAFTMKEQMVEFTAAGMNDVITKPVKADDLIGMVKKYLQEKPENKDVILTEEIVKSTQQQEETISNQEAETSVESKELNLKDDLLDTSNEVALRVSTVAELAKYGGTEIVRDTFEGFLEETDELIEEINTAMATNDPEGVRASMHTIKGTAGTLGVEKLAQAAKSGEGKLKAGDVSDLKEDVDKVLLYYNEFKELYQKWMPPEE
ncbi:PAS domain S-box protein [Limibacter armeniacum]|uniref:PAS domain-containing hybrid sensor histidine kinase/response regulator n=1 Tax=Limibacter armeniacum TaxID=466084 RepID=UPI002FE5955D